VNTISFIEEEL